jgi:HEPN domain-containing protein
VKVKDEKEWMLQAEYDLHAADRMFETGIYPYTIFMCHLSIEKALKAVYYHTYKEDPPKIHDLKNLIKISKLDVPANLIDFILTLTAASVPARYPEDLKRTLKDYDKKKTKQIIEKTNGVLKWIKNELMQK